MWFYIWLALTAFALIFEFLTNEVFSIWFAGGGIVAIILALFNVYWYIQIIAFVGVTAVLILLFRKLVLRCFDKGEDKNNIEMAVGKNYKLLSPIRFDEPGTIKVGDIFFNAVSENDAPIPEGTVVTVKEFKGNKYVVKAVNTTNEWPY